MGFPMVEAACGATTRISVTCIRRSRPTRWAMGQPARQPRPVRESPTKASAHRGAAGPTSRGRAIEARSSRPGRCHRRQAGVADAPDGGCADGRRPTAGAGPAQAARSAGGRAPHDPQGRLQGNIRPVGSSPSRNGLSRVRDGRRRRRREAHRFGTSRLGQPRSDGRRRGPSARRPGSQDHAGSTWAPASRGSRCGCAADGGLDRWSSPGWSSVPGQPEPPCGCWAS